MEKLVRKYQQKCRRAREEMERWDELQTRLLTQFGNASSIVQRLQVLLDPKNYGVLSCAQGIEKILSGKQMESLQIILHSMEKTLKDFESIVKSLEKIWRDGSQLSRGGSTPLTTQQMQLHVGIWPSPAYCVEGLRCLHDMHLSEYLLKSSIVSALSLNSSSSELAAFHQFLADQPNIPREEVQNIFYIIFAEEIS